MKCKILNVLILISTAFIFSCTAINKKAEEDYGSKSLYTGRIDNITGLGADNPERFQKNFPKSKLMLNGLITYKEQYTTRSIADNVTDFDFDNDSLVFLRKGVLYTNDDECKSIQLNNNSDKIQVSDNHLASSYKNRINIYSIKKCGKIFSFERKFQSFSFSFPYLVQYTQKKFLINKVGYNESVISGGLKSSIEKAHIYKDVVYFLDGENRIVPLVIIENGQKKPKAKFIKPKALNESSGRTLFHKNKIFKKTVDNVSVFNINNGDVSLGRVYKITTPPDNQSECKLKSKNALVCGRYVYVYSKNEYMKVGSLSDILVHKDRFFHMNSKRVLTVKYTDKKRYVKEVFLGRPEIKLCRKNKFYYLTDIDGKIKKIDSSEYSSEIVSSIPAGCKGEYTFENGSFYNSSNKKIMSIAEAIKKSGNYTMLLRKINDDFYYFFTNRQQ